MRHARSQHKSLAIFHLSTLNPPTAAQDLHITIQLAENKSEEGKQNLEMENFQSQWARVWDFIS